MYRSHVCTREFQGPSIIPVLHYHHHDCTSDLLFAKTRCAANGHPLRTLYSACTTLQVRSRRRPVADARKNYSSTRFSGAAYSKIDAPTDKVIGTIPVGQRVGGLAITRDGKKLYAANGNSNDVSVIDTATSTVVATVKAGDGPVGHRDRRFVKSA